MAESIVYIHGVPHSDEMWEPFIARTGGVAPDLPGFGATEKPANLDYSMTGQARWVASYLADIERYSLVMHDWGSLGLLAALERPEAVERIVLINAVPFLPGYRWHRVARAWRKPALGELLMGASTKWAFNRFSPLPSAEVDQIWKHWDHGTQRAILKLYRSAPEHALAAAGLDLPKLRGSRSLVVWGSRDPYLPARFAHDYAETLGGELHIAQGAGHWPWLDQPDVLDRVASFLSG